MKPTNPTYNNSPSVLASTMLAILLLLFVIQKTTLAQSNYTEYEVKAGYLVSLSKFIEWPDKSKEFTIGIIGKDPFGVILENMIRDAVGYNWIITHYQSAKEIDDHCKILFVSQHYKGSLTQLFEHIAGKTVLTVGEYHNGFCKKGGMIKINDKGDSRIFNINWQLAKNNCIKIKPELMRLARNMTSKVPSEISPCN